MNQSTRKYTPKQVADTLGVSVSWVRKWTDKALRASRKKGKRRVYTESDIKELEKLDSYKKVKSSEKVIEGSESNSDNKDLVKALNDRITSLENDKKELNERLKESNIMQLRLQDKIPQLAPPKETDEEVGKEENWLSRILNKKVI